ncbi:MAG TPA: hypothetical protein HA261_01415 [Methanosarcina sp.]|nr:hypothetical protein [Methanosarcina sp.]
MLGEDHTLLNATKRLRGYFAVKQEKTHHLIENSMMKNYAKKGKEKGLSFFGHVIRRISCAFFNFFR